ncbi:MAG: cytochrome c oxidase subunit II transmembrane domain-containing protein [Tepidisphaeraceae bacterium]
MNRNIAATKTRTKTRKKLRSIAVLPLLVAAAACLFCSSSASAADLLDGWGRWWLPPDRSIHGKGIDSLFIWTFWITMVTFVAVEICLVVFLIKYRARKGKAKAHFTHGNTRLEMAWTIAPAIILAGLALANKPVWDRLRFNPDANHPDKATILVIGEQFKWNVVYPGPDGKLGRYMLYPKPTDSRWPGGITFANVKGPAQLKYADAIKTINTYIDQENRLGKDFDDPAGKDDDWSKTPGREVNIPVGRPVEVQLSSRDVIHSFFLPNHRVKLDAVPGMRGKIVFTATMSSKQREQQSRRTYKMDELERLFATPVPPDMYVVITKDSPGAVKAPKGEAYLYVEDPKAAKPKTIVRSDQPLSQPRIADLKKAGITELTAYEKGSWDIVCEELCGANHYTMKGVLIVMESEEFRAKFQGGVKPTAPATQPSNVAMAK